MIKTFDLLVHNIWTNQMCFSKMEQKNGSLYHHYEFWLIVGRDCRDHMIAGFITTYVICLSPLTLRVWIPLRGVLLDTTLFDKVCQWLATGQWFSPNTPVASTNKTDHHDIIKILLKVALNTTTLNLTPGWLLVASHSAAKIMHIQSSQSVSVRRSEPIKSDWDR